jgi:drug/metabolite transporter (DMT)-like permease
MAQTKRRRTKHRGNAAGMVEARGRTGRKPTGTEKKPAGKGRAARPNRFDQPPTWRGAVNRALLAVVFFALLVILLFKLPIANAVGVSAFMLLLYIPLGYYTDLWLYRRRQRQKGQEPAK